MINFRGFYLFICFFLGISFLTKSDELEDFDINAVFSNSKIEEVGLKKIKIGLWVEDEFDYYKNEVNYLHEFIQKQGYDISKLRTTDLLNLELIDNKIDLIIIPYNAYPANGAKALDLFINSGGSLLLLNGNPFQNLILKKDTKWHSIESLGNEIKEFSSLLHWDYEGQKKTNQNSFDNRMYANGSGTDNDPYHLIPYNYYNNYISNSLSNLNLDNRVKGFSFMIKSESSFPLPVTIEILEENGNRWKKIIDVSGAWSNKSIHLSSFHPYAMERGKHAEAFIVPENIKRITFGLFRNISGSGNHEFKIKNLKFKSGSFPIDVRIKNDIPLFDLNRMQNAYNRHTILDYRFGYKWPQVYYSDSFFKTATIRKVKKNHLLLNDITASYQDNIEEFYPLYKWKAGFESSKDLKRFIPLLETADNDVLAGLYIINPKRNKNTPSTIMSIGLNNYKYSASKNLLSLINNYIKYVYNGSFIVQSEKELLKNGEKFVNRLAMRSSTREPNENLKLTLSQNNEEFKSFYISKSDSVLVCEFIKKNPLENSESYSVTLHKDNNDTLDIIESNFKPKETLKIISDFFSETINSNNGKLNGKGFVDSRGVRTLLASYDIFNDSKYLNSASKWANVIVAEQRADGGYRMGYGYSHMGEESYVADGGEIALALLRILSYLEEGDLKTKVLNSLESYFAFRESFRVLNNGIGVGYSAYNYGVPKSLPFGEVRALFGSDKNRYTVSLSLAASLIYANITNNSKAFNVTINDASWYMRHIDGVSGPEAEGFVYSHKLINNEDTKTVHGSYLLEAFVQKTVGVKNEWWTEREGRFALDLHNLAYVFNNISQAPNIELEMKRALNSMVSTESEYSIYKLINRVDLNKKDWIYLCNSSLGIAELVSPGVTFNKL